MWLDLIVNTKYLIYQVGYIFIISIPAWAFRQGSQVFLLPFTLLLLK